MLFRFNASSTTLPLPVSPASIRMVFPVGEIIRIESPLTGPTSSTNTFSSAPEAGGGCALHHGSTYFQPAYPAPPSTTTRTAIAHPQPLIDRRATKQAPSF